MVSAFASLRAEAIAASCTAAIWKASKASTVSVGLMPRTTPSNSFNSGSEACWLTSSGEP